MRRLHRQATEQLEKALRALDAFNLGRYPSKRLVPYSGSMESSDIQALHRACVAKLKNLIAVANRTCSLLESITEFPLTFDLWQKAMEQRIAENEAQAQYQSAREHLFAALHRQP